MISDTLDQATFGQVERVLIIGNIDAATKRDLGYSYIQSPAARRAA